MTAVFFQVGNQAFADYVDAQDFSATRINNKQDPVPVIPTMEFFEYHHVSGEIHIRNDDVWVACPGTSLCIQIRARQCLLVVRVRRQG